MEKNIALNAAKRLARYLIQAHWTGEALIGPDPGMRLEFRLWRFLKNYLRFIPWKDDRYLLQCQGYWVINCWKLFEKTEDPQFKEIALKCTKTIQAQQSKTGYWEHPLPNWRGKIATVEGIYASFGLLYTYRHIREPELLDSVKKWYEFLVNQIGFVQYKDSLGIHYFYQDESAMVPNNSTLLLAFLSELYEVTKDSRYLEYQPKLIRFLEYAQKDTGEMPYVFTTPERPGRNHLLCYQYNSFQFQDLARNFEITEDERIRSILKGIVKYLLTGITEKNSSRYTCFKKNPEVYYYSAVMAAALLKATQLGLGDYKYTANQIYKRLFEKQGKNGRFPFSQNNYLILRDGRSYPRYQSMILKHLLVRAEMDKE